jgi:hypothetical protein
VPRFGDIYSHSASVDLPSLRQSPGCLLPPSSLRKRTSAK